MAYCRICQSRRSHLSAAIRARQGYRENHTFHADAAPSPLAVQVPFWVRPLGARTAPVPRRSTMSLMPRSQSQFAVCGLEKLRPAPEPPVNAECTRDRRNASPEFFARLPQVRRKFSKYMLASALPIHYEERICGCRDSAKIAFKRPQVCPEIARVERGGENQIRPVWSRRGDLRLRSKLALPGDLRHVHCLGYSHDASGKAQCADWPQLSQAARLSNNN